MKCLQRASSLGSLSTLVVVVLIIISCRQTNTTPPASTVQPSEVVGSLSPISPVPTPVSPLPTPAPESTLPAGLTGPLAEFTINNDLRADFVHLPFYSLLVWTGMTWDGNDYVWIANNELKAIAGFNIKKVTSDRLVSFPFDLDQTPSVTGMAWDGASFWVSDVANEMIYQLDPITGERLKSFACDGTPNGLVWIDDSLWVISKDRLAIEKVTPTGERQLSLPIQGSWPSGLAWDGKCFWYSDGQEGTISILNPVTGKIKQLDEIKFMANRGTFNGLAWMSGYLWIATEGDQRLHRFDVSQLDWNALDAALQ